MKDPGAQSPDRVNIGKITRTQGRKGEVFTQILTDFPRRFERLKTVYLQYPQGSSTTLVVESTWLHRGGVVLKFEGVDTIDAAMNWVGSYVQIDKKDLMPLPEGTYYCFDLEGCEVVDEAGCRLGHVKSIDNHGGNTLLSLETQDGHEIMVPAAREYLIEVNTDMKRIVIRLPDDLVTLNS